MRKGELFTMKLTAINIGLLMLLLLPLASSLTFTLQAPESVKINETFQVSIIAETNDKYDVKIFAYNETQSSIISEILQDGKWKNPFYYLSSAFPEQTNFSIRILSSPGERSICARLRKVKGTGYSQQIINISVSPSDTQQAPIKNETSIPKPKNQTKTSPSTNITNSTQPETKQNPTQNTAQTPQNISQTLQGKIILNPEQEVSFITKEEKKRLWIVYSFAILCVILIILLSLGKL